MRDTNGTPDWFDIERYVLLNRLNDNELCEQLRSRVSLYQAPVISDHDIEIAHRYWQDIIVIDDRYDFLDDHNLNFDANISPVKKLPYGNSIKAVDIFQIYGLFRIAQDNYDYPLDDKDGFFLTPDIFKNIDLLSKSDSVTLNINLSWSNAMILRELKTLLPIYRKMLDIKTPGDPQNTARKKTLDYQLIPYLDLLIYCKVFHEKINNQAIAEALFPLGHRDEKFISGTLKNFLKTITTSCYLDEWLEVSTEYCQQSQ